jgi:hypothetical protein
MPWKIAMISARKIRANRTATIPKAKSLALSHRVATPQTEEGTTPSSRTSKLAEPQAVFEDEGGDPTVGIGDQKNAGT